ncbi:hypothetical protein D3C86_1651420 [compost metagenome]
MHLKTLRAEKEERLGQRGQLMATKAEIENILGAGGTQPGSRWHFAERRQRFRSRIRSLGQFVALRDTYEQQRPRPLARVMAEMAKRAEQAKDEYRACEGEIREALGHYRLNFDSTAPIAVPGGIIAEIKPWVATNVAAVPTAGRRGCRSDQPTSADRVHP